MIKLCALLISFVIVCSAFCGEEVKRSPDSEYHDGVPKGKVEKQPPWRSKIFPGTERDWWIYVPAQYDPAKPANVMVFQDGGGPVNVAGEMRAPVVFDNLINKIEMPVTIGIFINPGVLPPADNAEFPKSESLLNGEIAVAVARGKSREEAEKSIPKTASRLPRMNRAFEYDSVGDRYARFLLEEILPEVEKKYNLTKDPAGRAVCGQSSGGSCAFTVAWERPDAFAKVVSGIGSFTSLHGCNAYPDLIRKTEPKPIRIYMQDGDHDLDIYAGSWWHANQDMAAAFNWMGYDYFFLQGHDGHSGKQLGMNFPDAMRWLWRADPVEGKRPEKADQRGVWEVLIKGEGWKHSYMLSETDLGGAVLMRGCDVDDSGVPYFLKNNKGDNGAKIMKLNSDGSAAEFADFKDYSGEIKFGPDGKLYGAAGDKIACFDKEGKRTDYAELNQGKGVFSLAFDHTGALYCGVLEGHITLINAKKEISTLTAKTGDHSILQLIPDQGFMAIIDRHKSAIDSFQIGADAKLNNGEPFYTLQSAEGENLVYANASAVEDKGRLYVACKNGIQILDQAGRVIGILNLPLRTSVTGIAFGGPNFDTLYLVTMRGIYSRKLNARGVLSCKPPVIPPKPQM